MLTIPTNLSSRMNPLVDLLQCDSKLIRYPWKSRLDDITGVAQLLAPGTVRAVIRTIDELGPSSGLAESYSVSWIHNGFCHGP